MARLEGVELGDRREVVRIGRDARAAFAVLAVHELLGLVGRVDYLVARVGGGSALAGSAAGRRRAALAARDGDAVADHYLASEAVGHRDGHRAVASRNSLGRAVLAGDRAVGAVAAEDAVALLACGGRGGGLEREDRIARERDCDGAVFAGRSAVSAEDGVAVEVDDEVGDSSRDRDRAGDVLGQLPEGRSAALVLVQLAHGVEVFGLVDRNRVFGRTGAGFAARAALDVGLVAVFALKRDVGSLFAVAGRAAGLRVAAVAAAQDDAFANHDFAGERRPRLDGVAAASAFAVGVGIGAVAASHVCRRAFRRPDGDMGGGIPDGQGRVTVL